MSAPENPTNSESESEIDNTPNSDSGLTSDSLSTVNPSSPPLVCLLRFAGDSAAGAFMGSVFGYGNHVLPFRLLVNYLCFSFILFG